MNSKLNKSELEKMLSDLQSEVKIIKNKVKHYRTEQLNYKKNIDKIKTDIDNLNKKKSLLMDNIGKLNSLISASKKI